MMDCDNCENLEKKFGKKYLEFFFVIAFFVCRCFNVPLCAAVAATQRAHTYLDPVVVCLLCARFFFILTRDIASTA